MVEDGVNVTIKPPRQNPGRREVIGIIDAAVGGPVPAVDRRRSRTPPGAFVKPTAASMLDGDRARDGQQRTASPGSVDLTDKDPGIYPLSLLVSAALSTKAPADERAEMADFLTYVADAGQVPGDEVGQLPGRARSADRDPARPGLARPQGRARRVQAGRPSERYRVGLAHGRPHRPVGRTLRRRRRCPTRRGGARPG